MSMPDTMKWFKLEFIRSSEMLTVNYEDSSGAKVFAGQAFELPEPGEWPEALFIDPVIRQHIERLADSLEPAPGERKRPMAVYVDTEKLPLWPDLPLRRKDLLIRRLLLIIIPRRVNFQLYYFNGRVLSKQAISYPITIGLGDEDPWLYKQLYPLHRVNIPGALILEKYRFGDGWNRSSLLILGYRELLDNIWTGSLSTENQLIIVAAADYEHMSDDLLDILYRSLKSLPVNSIILTSSEGQLAYIQELISGLAAGLSLFEALAFTPAAYVYPAYPVVISSPDGNMVSHFTGGDRYWTRIYPELQEDFPEEKWITNNLEALDPKRDNKARKVDVSLQQGSDPQKWLSKDSQIEPGAFYRLHARIALKGPHSLMEGEVPALDPLLPDPGNEKGHQVDFVVFPKDFTLESASLQTVFLPVTGESSTAIFGIVAPKEGDAACLRIGVFHRNVLLQSFLLEAGMPGRDSVAGISVRLDVANSEKFDNLDELKERGLFIGLNGNLNGTHSIFFKKDEVAEEIVGINQSDIESAQVNFCRLIREIYGDEEAPRYDLDSLEGAPFSNSFYEDVRKLAQFGASRYNLFFEPAKTSLGKKLKEIRELSDQHIAIARHQMDFAFPWAVIYDYPVPPEIAGNAPYPVCTGQAFAPDQYKDFYDESWQGCEHNPHHKCYCTSGFWGIRHRIEQLLASATATNSVMALSMGANQRVILSQNFAEQANSQLNSDLQRLPVQLTEITYDKDLLTLLWDTSTRPLVLAVIGHLETNRVAGEPDCSRIITFPKKAWPADRGPIPAEKWIFRQLLQNKIMRDDAWEGDPLPMVFLINCSSMGMNFNSLDAISKAFHTAGASAIIGTEGTIHASIGTRFLKEVLEDLYVEQIELGQAIQEFNKRMFALGAPVAFIFTCFGNSNLKLV